MERMTIDYGIDLGTTNSCISVLESTGAMIIRNNEGWPYTPSAVSVEKDGSIRTGRSAKDRLVSYPGDAVGAFKRWMGTTQSKDFTRSGTRMNAEQLSAEVLKALRDEVKKQKGEDLEAAVITVPASFDLPASEATKRAASLAGFVSSPLLQEPIAAALAYGFRETQKNAFWLVYDFGGGTFDAAVIHVRDGEIQVVNHGGDNYLGGGDLDWALVDNFLVPHLTRKYTLTDFRRGNEKWIRAFAKLKGWAEAAKIAVSKEKAESIQEDSVCNDDNGRPVELDYLLTRAEVESVLRPLLYRSIDMCRRVLGEAKLSASHIERTILVGGPTYTPFLREILADPKEGLGIQVDFSADPLTVVAQGAAIFAGGRRLPARRSTATANGTYTVALSYDPIGSDLEPLVGGTVTALSKKPLSGYTIRFANPRGTPPWDSGKIPLDEAGTFSGFLLAQLGGANEYHIELFDQSGRACPVTPTLFTYTVGLTITKPPLTHNIGIAEAGNRVHVLFVKGTPLPAKATAKHVTIGLIRRGNGDDALRIPIIEGEATDAADENRKIGEFSLTGSEIDRDIPADSGVEIRLAIDDSRTIKASVYIPVLDLERDFSLDGLVKPTLPIAELEQEFTTERNALNESQELAEAVKSKPALIELESMNRQEVVQGIENLLQHGGTDADLKSCEEQLVALRRARRRIEVILTAPKMQQEAQDELRWTQALLEEVGTNEDRAKFIDLKRKTELALVADPDILRKAIDALSAQRIELWLRTPDYWLGYREYLAGEKSKMLDETQADRWLIHADRAIASGDTEALRVACRQLNALLPRDVQTVGYGGSTLRAR
ncbi:Hsp70 family protein [Edaphobacter modestus]|uniref:Molecular chaperone DnaK n=1 Tax=Edaphobacter modestus TaxID=388466 RepID=A0A4Q7XZS4_9BACT|nr:Hsp70 family protein [Edaphobacter modestus]RZU29073.1 molecular chaperone DnaK [Edaphobacter modestus]